MIVNTKIFEKNKEFVFNNIYAILLGLILATLFFKENINSLMLITFIGIWLYNKDYQKINTNQLLKIKWYVIFILIYLILVLLGMFSGGNFSSSISYLFKQSLILLFILVTINLKWSNDKFEIINKIFIAATFIFVLYIWAEVIYQIIKLNNIYILDPVHPTWKYYLFTSGRLSPEVHPTYLSIYLVYCLYNLNFLKTKNKIIYILISTIFSITFILLSSRGAIISLFAVLFFYLIRTVFIHKSKKSGIALFSLITLTLIIFSNSTIMNRVSKLRNLYDHSTIEIANINNSIGKRTQIYLISTKIIKDNFILGIGTKNWREINKKYYEKYFTQIFKYNIESLNTHNQYLNAFISWGILGLIFMFIMFIQLFYLSYKTKNLSNLLFWCFFFLVLSTENVLDRHRGIIFFSVISALTVVMYIQKLDSFNKHNLNIPNE